MQKVTAIRPSMPAQNMTAVIERVRASHEYMQNLIDLATMKKASADSYNDAVSDVAEKLELDATALKQYVNAIVNDKLNEFEMRAEQLSLFVEEKP